MNGRPTGTELGREIEAYLRRVRCTEAAFCRASGISDRTVNSIRHSHFPTVRTVQRVRDFIDAWPVRLPAEPVAANAPTRKGAAIVADGGTGSADIDQAQARSIAPARPEITPAMAAASDAAPRNVSPHRIPHAPRMPAVEAVSTLVVETPGDLVGMIKRRWPVLWEQVRAKARAAETPPGAMLIALIERGMEVEA